MKILISLASEIVPDGVYSSVKPLGQTEEKMEMFLDLVDSIDPIRDDCHVTVLYSRNANKVDVQPESMRKLHVAQLKEFTSWIGHDDKPYLVALLDSPDLHQAWQDWIDLGYTVDFPDYRPHITIKKGLDEAVALETVVKLNRELAIHDNVTLTFGAQKISQLRD